MSEFVFKGDITGDGHQFGDTYYNDPQLFVQKANREFSDIENALIEIIFANFQSEEQKRELLDSLKNLSDDPSENKIYAPLWNKFVNQLTEQGFKEAANLVLTFAKDKMTNILQSINEQGTA